MTNFRRITLALCIGLTIPASLPTSASAQATTPTGGTAQQTADITTCTPGGGQPPQSVGVSSASGIFVPVADAAVIANSNKTVDNTGTLVYKECVVRVLVNDLREKLTVEQAAKMAITYSTSRDGRALFVQRRQAERGEAADRKAIPAVAAIGAKINEADRGAIQNAIGRRYYLARRDPLDALSCVYGQADLASARAGKPTGSTVEALRALADPACNPILNAWQADSVLASAVGSAVENFDTTIAEGQGNYPRYAYDENGDMIIRTPSSMVKTLVEQQFTSGFRQQENANDVGQLVSSLFANMSSQMLANDDGIANLFRPTGGAGSPTYLESAVSAARGSLQGATASILLSGIKSAYDLERAYNSVVTAIASNLTQTIGQLRSTERQCYTSIIEKVCTAGLLVYGIDGTATCVSTSGPLRVATSTVFSQAVVTAQIAPAASTTLANLARSNQSLTALTTIMSSLSGSPSQAAQSAAVSQYNQLVSSGALHSQSDITQAQSQQQSITTATASLVQNTINTWAGTDDSGNSTIPWDGTVSPGKGWCNYQNQPTLTAWINQWKQ